MTWDPLAAVVLGLLVLAAGCISATPKNPLPLQMRDPQLAYEVRFRGNESFLAVSVDADQANRYGIHFDSIALYSSTPASYVQTLKLQAPLRIAGGSFSHHESCEIEHSLAECPSRRIRSDGGGGFGGILDGRTTFLHAHYGAKAAQMDAILRTSGPMENPLVFTGQSGLRLGPLEDSRATLEWVQDGVFFASLTVVGAHGVNADVTLDERTSTAHHTFWDTMVWTGGSGTWRVQIQVDEDAPGSYVRLGIIEHPGLVDRIGAAVEGSTRVAGVASTTTRAPGP